ncbi:VWA domain-containing protein [Picrophilus oshimae]|uniref:Protoporphyrin IX magnesium-chelatase n=2 Tax=Picrophilus torridus (strain ATCC 700027 / DSM 9790 / JCM 10055 / NBRC 100828 / KAW 2/3) TaxID=1122961 RepID=A0A8G2FXY1_PICTO|nr:VWA domain-containing protein [Picrophilus oshimae]SMD31551.1 protoporphyrin IX magnesium-chelatase [Picrophilus oshimae DSM 9789]
MKTVNFPFSAIVKQDLVKLGLLINAIDPGIGGILIIGPKGIAKTTMVRSLSEILPEIKSTGCRFNCDPDDENSLCDECLDNLKNKKLKTVYKKIDIKEIPLSATIDRVAGSLDVKAALHGEVRLNEGILGEANRNILYIDEVNLLDDSIVDAILDSAATGINRVERENLSYVHPARFILIGTMNPEEGDLRPQLLDRFGISVTASLPESIEEMVEISKRVEDFNRDPVSFQERYMKNDIYIKNKIINARINLYRIKIDDDDLRYLASRIMEKGLGNRAMIAAVKSARAIAAYYGRKKPDKNDLDLALYFAMNHRSKDVKKPEINNNINNDFDHKDNKDGSNENDKSSKNDYEIHNQKGNEKDVKSVEFRIKTSNDSGRVSTGSGFNRASFRPGSHLDIHGTLLNMAMNMDKSVMPYDLSFKSRISQGSMPFIIAVDASKSMKFKSRINDAINISSMILKEAYVKRSRVSLVSFSGTQASLISWFSRNFSSIEASLRSIKSSGKTPLADALRLCADISKRYNKKTVSFFLTDGRGNYPDASYKRIYDAAEYLGRYSRVFVINDDDFLPGYNKAIADASNGIILKKDENLIFEIKSRIL